MVEYISKKLKDGNAEHAGDPALQGQKRKFGLIYISTSDAVRAGRPTGSRQQPEGRPGSTLAERLAYKSPVDLQNDAPGLIAKLKAAGVTSVLFAGDPVAPQPLTRAATGAGVLPGVDHDRRGAHRHVGLRPHLRPEAVGPRLRRELRCGPHDPDTNGSQFLYQWYFGHDAPASTAAATSVINPALFFAVIQGMGPQRHGPGLPGRPLRRRLPRPGPSPSRRCPTATRASGPSPTTPASTTPPRSGGTRRRQRHGRDRAQGPGHVPVRRRGQALPARRVADRADQGLRQGRRRVDLHRTRRRARSTRTTRHRPADGRTRSSCPLSGASDVAEGTRSADDRRGRQGLSWSRR